MATDIRARLDAFRQQQRDLAWQGTFDDYFTIVTTNPKVAQLAHARVYDMIMQDSVEEGPDGIPRHQFFAHELFGLEKPVGQIVEYFSAAAKRLEPRKRILLLMGPVGGGKSTVATLLREGLERYTRTPEGALYAIAGCPMHEEPLHLIPKELRQEVREEHGLYIEGTLCPSCAYRLKTEWDNDIYRVPVERITFSAETRMGLGTFAPSDPKCVTGDTILLTDRGMLRFDELQAEVGAAEDAFAPLTLGVVGRKGPETTSHFYNGGVKPTRRLRTRFGYELEGSHVHPVLTIRDGEEQWVSLADIQVGDRIALQRGSGLFGATTALPSFRYAGPRSGGGTIGMTFPECIDARLARLLGYIVAEGSLTDTALWITNGNRRVLDDIHSLCAQLFGVRPKDYGKADGSCSSVTISSITLVHWLENVCGITRRAANTRIPRVVMTAPRPIVLAFLEGWFWGDGTVSSRTGLESNRFKVATASREMARQAQVILLNLGIVSALYKETIQQRDTAYSVVATGDGVVDLLNLIPSLQEKSTDGPRIVAKRQHGNVGAIAGLQPLVLTALREVAAVGGKTSRRDDRYAIAPTTTWGRDITPQVLERLVTESVAILGCETPALARLREHARSSLLWLEVRDIEEKTAHVYDLTVPGSHSFCANGFVNHNSQDVSELVGSIDLSTIAEIGVESDPRAYRFDGEFNVANRGIVEMIELLKSDEKLLYSLLTLTQEQNIKTGRFSLIYADEVVLAHTNENEFKAFAGNPKAEALHDRIILVKVPYNLRVSEEIKIYDKLLASSNLSGVHIAPHTLNVASIFAVLSRLEPSKKANMTAMKKLKLYDGQDVEGWKTKDVKELQEEAQREGMDGISPRYIIDRLSNALIRNGVSCINPINALRALRDGFEQHTSFNREDREHLLNLIAETRHEYDDIAKKEVQRAFVYAFEESAKTLLNNYLDNVESYCRKEKMRDPLTDEEVDPDERLMRSIEEQIAVTENGKGSFRESILMAMASLARRGKNFEYTSDERLKEAIEKKLFADLKDVIKITTSSKTPDAEQLRRVNDVVDRMIRDNGYCVVCAQETLQYVGQLLNR